MFCSYRGIRDAFLLFSFFLYNMYISFTTVTNNRRIANGIKKCPRWIADLRKKYIALEKKFEIKLGPRGSPLAPLFVVHRSGMEKLIHRKKFHGRAVYSDTSIWLTSPCGFRCVHRFWFFIQNLFSPQLYPLWARFVAKLLTFHYTNYHYSMKSERHQSTSSCQLKAIKNVSRQYRAR